MSYLEMSFEEEQRDFLRGSFSKSLLSLEVIKGRRGVYSITDSQGTKLGLYKEGDPLKIEIDMRYHDQEWVRGVENAAFSVDASTMEPMSPNEMIDQFLNRKTIS